MCRKLASFGVAGDIKAQLQSFYKLVQFAGLGKMSLRSSRLTNHLILNTTQCFDIDVG